MALTPDQFAEAVTDEIAEGAATFIVEIGMRIRLGEQFNSVELLTECYQRAFLHGGEIASKMLSDSIKEITKGI